jgi:hypothetical protein
MTATRKPSWSLFSLTKFTQHPGFVPDLGLAARKRRAEKIPVCLLASCQEGSGSFVTWFMCRR